MAPPARATFEPLAVCDEVALMRTSPPATTRALLPINVVLVLSTVMLVSDLPMPTKPPVALLELVEVAVVDSLVSSTLPTATMSAFAPM
jgi:hypothetical protein